MAEGSLQAQNIPLNVAPNDPELPRKTYEAVRQMVAQLTELRKKVRDLEERVLN